MRRLFGSRPAGPRLYLLAALAAVLLLVPAAAASAANKKASVEFEGSGSGTVVGVSPSQGNPALNCHKPSQAEDVCETEMIKNEGIVGQLFREEAAAGSEFVEWIPVEGEPLGCEETTNSECGMASFGTPVKVIAVFNAEPTPPSNLTLPTITGTAKVGKTLHGHPGTWSGEPETFTNKWLRCNAAGEECGEISGATGTEYEVTEEDIGSTIRFEETAENGLGSASATSSQTEVVPASVGNGEAILTPERNVYGEVEQTTELTSECAEELFLGNFEPGKTQEYEVPCKVIATSTGEESALTASDTTGEEVGYLTQEPEHPYTLAQLLQAKAVDLQGLGESHSNGFGTFGEAEGPYTMLTYGKPVAGDEVEVTFKQPINKNDPLHSGVYQKTVTLTLAQTAL